jgi:MFS family permease
MASDRSLIAALCAGELLTMIGVFAFPALLPTFIDEWHLSKSEAGWIGGIYFLGYALTAPPLLLLTDRIDARRIWIAGALLAAATALAFAAFADGFWTAFVLRFLAGTGLAATYMPGLRTLVDRYRGATPSRAVATYTATFSLGTAVSFFLAGKLAAAFGWRGVFLAAGLACLGAAAIGFGLRPLPPRPEAGPWPGWWELWRVVRNRPAVAYILGYGVHCWELFALRTWLVALLAFSLAAPWAMGLAPAPTDVAAMSGVVAMMASIAGNEMCLRFGRRRVIIATMTASALAAAGIGFASAFAYLVIVVLALGYAALVQLDSGALIAGAVAAAEPRSQGATLALFSFFGFGCAAVGPLVVGVVLDATGEGRTTVSWGLAFASVAVVGLMGPLVMAAGRRPVAP